MAYPCGSYSLFLVFPEQQMTEVMNSLATEATNGSSQSHIQGKEAHALLKQDSLGMGGWALGWTTAGPPDLFIFSVYVCVCAGACTCHRCHTCYTCRGQRSQLLFVKHHPSCFFSLFLAMLEGHRA